MIFAAFALFGRRDIDSHPCYGDPQSGTPNFGNPPNVTVTYYIIIAIVSVLIRSYC